MNNDHVFFTTSQPHQQEETTLTCGDILDAQNTLNGYTEERDKSFQKFFKEFFGADYKRGDIAVFTKYQKSTYDLLCRELSSDMMKQIRIDKSGELENPVILNGEFILGIGRDNPLV